MADLVSSLIVKLIDQVTGPAKAVARSVGLIGEAAKKGGGTITALDRLDAALARNNNRLANARTSMIDAIAGYYTLKKTLGAAVNAATEFEQAFADVKKVVEFPAEGALSAKNFAAALLDLSHTVPLAATELTAIAAAGGQAGIATDQLLAFTEAVAQVSTAFEISTEESGTALANLMAALKLTVPDVMLLSDHMNVLANNMATSERQVLDVTNRVAALGSVVGVAPKHVAALGAAMTSAGADAESAGTGIRNMFLNLSQGLGMTNSQLGAFEELGLSAKEFPKRMQTEGIGAIVDVLERVSKLSKERQAAVLTDLFDKRAVDSIGPLLNNLDLLRQALGLIENDAANAGAAMREFNKRNDTFGARVATLKNSIYDLGVSIGNVLIPHLTTLVERMKPIVNAVAEWVDRNGELVAGIAGAAAGLVGLNIALMTLKYAGFLAFGTILQLVRIIPALTAAMAGLTGISAPWLALAAALIAVAGAAYYYRDEIGKALGMSGDLAFSLLYPMIAAFTILPKKLAELTYRVIYRVTAIVQTMMDMAPEMLEAGKQFVQSLWDGMSAMFDSLVAWVREKANAILAPFRNLGARVRGALGIGSGGAGSAGSMTGETDAGRAKGGPVSPGRAYLVGERRPEIFSTQRAGYITPLDKAGGGGGAVTVSPVFNMTFNGAADPQATTDAIRRVLREEVRQIFRGVYADTSFRFA